MIVVVVLISSWYWLSRNAEKLRVTMIVMKPWTSQASTSSKQNAKNGARLAITAAQPANRSKKPTRVETSLGMTIKLGGSGTVPEGVVFMAHNLPTLPAGSDHPGGCLRLAIRGSLA